MHLSECCSKLTGAAAAIALAVHHVLISLRTESMSVLTEQDSSSGASNDIACQL
jgi:hypothetical protein